MSFSKLFLIFFLFAVLVHSEFIHNSGFQEDPFAFVKRSRSKFSLDTIVTDESEKCFMQNDVNFKKINIDLPLPLEAVYSHSNFSDPAVHTNDIASLRSLSKILLDEEKVFGSIKYLNVSRKCQRDSQYFLLSLRNLELWALKMFDSSARLPSGILNGNVNQYGDFDQCLEVTAHSKGVRGQYCLANLQLLAPENIELLGNIKRLVESYNAFRSEFDDPGHRIPRFSGINWALCAPSSCSPSDLEYSLANFLANTTTGTGISFHIRVDPQMCYRRTVTDFDKGTVITTIFFIFIIALCWLCTIYDYQTPKSIQSEWLTSFSIKKNMHALLSVDEQDAHLEIVHGIRFLNALMLLFAHKAMAVFFNPYINRTQLSFALSSRWTVVGRAASLYTEPFLMLSGMLASYSQVRRLQKHQVISLKFEYITRVFRILPCMLALILFCTYLLPQLGSGPQWNLVVQHHSYLCKRFWWRNLLFIHNIFGFNNMCLTHTHHIALDTQLFLLTPLATLGLWLKPMTTTLGLLLLMTVSTFVRFHTTVAHELSNYVHFGTSTQRLLNTADLMYTSPLHRSTVYIIGVLLGYFLRMHKKIDFGHKQLQMGWMISVICLIGTFFFASLMNHTDYIYNPIHAGYFASVAPLTWCLLFVWMILISYNGQKNNIINLLSWKGFQVTTKFSYALYLTQFPIFFYNVGRRRSADFFNFIEVMFNTNEYLCIILASLLLTLVFDIPFKNIKKILFG